MNLNATLRLLTGIGIGGFLVFVVITFVSKENHKRESERKDLVIENLLNEKDQLHTRYELDKKELKTYIETQEKKLDSTLKEMDIKLRKVSKVVKTTYVYKDTIINRVELNPVLDSIYSGRPISFPFTDSTKCIQIKGVVEFKEGKLSHSITSRVVNDEIYTVTNWYRKWFLGRKHYKVDIITGCGTSKTVVINRKK